MVSSCVNGSTLQRVYVKELSGMGSRNKWMVMIACVTVFLLMAAVKTQRADNMTAPDNVIGSASGITCVSETEVPAVLQESR
jgi:hypothetical protein